MGDLLTRRRELVISSGGGYQHGTWDDLFYHIDLGDVDTAYALGETIVLDLGTGNTPEMQIIAFNTDIMTADDEPAAVTFLSKTAYKTTHRMNPAKEAGVEGTGTLGGWEKCELRSYLIDTVFPLIPVDVARRIVAVNKYSKIYTVSDTVDKNYLTSDKIWIPNYKELNWSGAETSGVSYSVIGTSTVLRSKTKYNSTTKTAWYTRTAYSSTLWYTVASTGGSNTGGGSSAIYYPIGFCVN